MFNGDYSLVNGAPKNVEEAVWVGKGCVGPFGEISRLYEEVAKWLGLKQLRTTCPVHSQ